MNKTIDTVYIIFNARDELISICKNRDKIMQKIYNTFEDGGYYSFEMRKINDNCRKIVFFKPGSRCTYYSIEVEKRQVNTM